MAAQPGTIGAQQRGGKAARVTEELQYTLPAESTRGLPAIFFGVARFKTQVQNLLPNFCPFWQILACTMNDAKSMDERCSDGGFQCTLRMTVPSFRLLTYRAIVSIAHICPLLSQYAEWPRSERPGTSSAAPARRWRETTAHQIARRP